MAQISEIIAAGQCLQLGILDGNIALLTFGRLDSRVNAAHSLLFSELKKHLAVLRTRPLLKGLIFQSNLPGFFISGADLKELSRKRDQPGKVAEVIHLALEGISELENLPFPTLALIDGVCLGGGLEIAMGLDFRYASAGKKTELGMPETKLGLIPGWGGTQRLTRFLGFDLSMNLVLTGRSLSGREALEQGLVDALVPPENLMEMGVKKILETHHDGTWASSRAKKSRVLAWTTGELSLALQSWRKNTSCHPLQVSLLCDLMEKTVRLPLGEALKLETASFLKAWEGPLGKNLVALFFLKQGISKKSSPSLGLAKIDSVGVVGSGVFGPKIAEWFARAGFNTMLVDRVPVNLGRGTTLIIEEMHRNLQAGGIPQKELLEILGRLSTSTVSQSLIDRQFVLESAVENEVVKAAIFRELDAFLPPTALLASNTNTLSITRLGRELKNPGNFAGFHFVSRVFPNDLVEIVRGEKTSDECLTAFKGIARRLGKIPLLVNDSPGFLVCRLLVPMIQEAQHLVADGATPALVDEALEEFGFPLGFFKYVDLLGLDAFQFLADSINQKTGSPDAPPGLVQELVRRGRSGHNSGLGFWSYSKSGEKKT